MEQRAQNLSPATLPLGEDRLLAAEVLRKDRKATADFVARYADAVFAYVRRRVWPRMDVTEDLVQETFLAAWQSLSSYRGDSSLRSWVLGIARHKVEDYYRRQLQEFEVPEDSPEPTVIPMVEDRLDRKQREKMIREVLADLPAPYAIVLLWRYLENRSVREMASISGKTEKAIERMLSRARQSFRRRWSDGPE
jgi:RNA polymerase sigma-70 factor (ECF subfamily)